MSSAHSTVISMRLPVASGNRLKRMANRYGWTPSDASARLVEEGLRRSEFAFVDFRDSAAGRQVCIQAAVSLFGKSCSWSAATRRIWFLRRREIESRRDG
jgi:hypothetical protein